MFVEMNIFSKRKFQYKNFKTKLLNMYKNKQYNESVNK